MEVYKRLIEELRPQVEALSLLVALRQQISDKANEEYGAAFEEHRHAVAALRQLLILTGEEKEVDY